MADNADITITGVTSTIPQGFGFIVESTSTLHTYTFHRLVPKATEVTTVANVASNVTTVATNIANVNTVASDLNESTSEIDTVATNITNVNTVGNAIANVNTTAGDIANVNTVAGSISNVNTVAANDSNVTAVANNASNINSAVSNATNINSAVSNASNINTVAGSISNVNTTATNIANVNTTATNIGDVNNFAATYQIASTAPSTDGAGNALAAGDLYFDTSANELRVHNGTTFQGGVTATGNLAGTGANNFTGDQTISSTHPKLIFNDTDSENDFHIANQNGTLVVKDLDANATRLQIESNGQITSTGNHGFNSGISVTGNVVVSGHVDGRDVAADGVNLDTIRSGEIGTTTTNGNIKLEPNGTGVVEVRGAGGNDGTLQLNCSAQSHGIKLKSPPHSAGQSYTLTFPSSIVNNGALKTDSSGNLSFGLIQSANITDGTIVNADINASAAIAGTKISPDFGSQNITTTGDLNAKDITLTDGSPAINFL